MSKPIRVTCTGGGPFDGSVIYLGSVPKAINLWTPYRRTTYTLVGFTPGGAVLVYKPSNVSGQATGVVSREAVEFWESHYPSGTTNTAMVGMWPA